MMSVQMMSAQPSSAGGPFSSRERV